MTPREERFAAWKAKPGRPTLVALLEASQGRVFAICQNVLRDRHEAEEAAQETLLKIVLGVENVRDLNHFEHWSGQVAYRTALNKRRSLRLRRVREVESVRNATHDAEPWQGVHDAIEELPAEDRALILERYFERRTLGEMGQRRGISDVGIRKRIEKAHGRLRKRLGGFLAGVLAMNMKTLAACAIVLLALLGGIKVVLRGTSSVATAEVASAQDTPGVSPGVKPTGLGVALEVPKVESVNRRQWTLERLRGYAAAWGEHKELSQLESGKAKSEDAQQTMAKLYQELQEHSWLSLQSASGLFDPLACVDFFTSPEGMELKGNLMFLLKPAIELEIESEESLPGPVMSALLAVSMEARRDKFCFLHFAQHIAKSNRAVADIAFRWYTEDERLQNDAMGVLAVQASRGNLKESIRARADFLLRIAMIGPDQGSRRFWEPGESERLRGGAWAALMVVDRPDIDELLVRRMETSSSSREALGHAEHLALSARRILTTHAERFSTQVRAGADLPFGEAPHFHVLLLSTHLSVEAGTECLRYYAARLPAGELKLIEGVNRAITMIGTGQSAKVLNVLEEIRKAGPTLDNLRALAAKLSN